MRGVIFEGNRKASIREFPEPKAGPGEAIIQIKASGLCGTVCIVIEVRIR